MQWRNQYVMDYDELNKTQCPKGPFDPVPAVTAPLSSKAEGSKPKGVTDRSKAPEPKARVPVSATPAPKPGPSGLQLEVNLLKRATPELAKYTAIRPHGTPEFRSTSTSEYAELARIEHAAIDKASEAQHREVNMRYRVLDWSVRRAESASSLGTAPPESDEDDSGEEERESEESVEAAVSKYGVGKRRGGKASGKRGGRK
jgi:hypothetical protein